MSLCPCDATGNQQHAIQRCDLPTKGRQEHGNQSALKPVPSHGPRRHILKTHSGLAGFVWRQRQPLQYPSHSHGQPLMHDDQLPSPQTVPEQQSMLQAELVSAAAAAGKQQHRPPPPGFEDSTAGSQWLHAVKMAGLAEGQDYQEPADKSQDNQQAWANVQPVATVLLLLTEHVVQGRTCLQVQCLDAFSGPLHRAICIRSHVFNCLCSKRHHELPVWGCPYDIHYVVFQSCCYKHPDENDMISHMQYDSRRQEPVHLD